MIDVAIIPIKQHFSSPEDPWAQHSIEHPRLDGSMLEVEHDHRTFGVCSHPATWIWSTPSPWLTY